MNLSIILVLSIFYWILLIAGIVLFHILPKVKEIVKSKLGITLSVIIFLYFLQWIPFGFDLTDEGFILTQSWFMFHGQWSEYIGNIWGSLCINGLWLSLFKFPSVIWARLAYVIVVTASSAILLNILQKYFNPVKSFVAVILATILFNSGVPQTLNYNNLPVFLILLSLSFFLNNDVKKNFKLLIAGFLIAMAGYCRITFFVFGLLPIVILGYQYLTDRKNIKIIKKKITFSYLGILIGIITGIVVLILTSSQDIYFGNIIKSYHSFGGKGNITAHTQSNLLQLYIGDIKLLFIKVFILSLALYIPLIIDLYKCKKNYKNVIYVMLAIFFYWFLSIHNDKQIWKFVIISCSISVLIFSFLNSKPDWKKKNLLLAAYFFMIFSYPGSDHGIRMVLISGSGSLAIITSFLLFEESIIYFYDKKYINSQIIKALAVVSIIMLFHLKPSDIYREMPRIRLDKSFETKILNGIYSYQSKVDAIDKMLLSINKINTNGQTCLTFGSIPMFHFLTGIKPFLENPWYFNQNEFSEKVKKGNSPDFIVFSKQNPRNPYWPQIKESPFNSDDSVHLIKLKTFIAEHKYELYYSNNMFDIYSTNK